MATYGMRDAANLTFVNKKTGNIDLFLDYANATSTEWTSDRVYAMKKGTNAIAWDTGRVGTLTIDSELFDLSYLAMILGSDITKGTNQVIKRKVYDVEESRGVKVSGNVDLESVSVVKVAEDGVEHEGLPLQSTTSQLLQLPSIVKNVVASANDKTAKITFDGSERASSYEIRRDGEIVGTVTAKTFTDTGLTPATAYEYTVTAVNDFGSSAVSAVVKAKTSAIGVTDFTPHNATPEAIALAEKESGVLNVEAENAVTFNIAGDRVQLSEKAVIGEKYAIYFMENVENVRSLEISADKFAGSYEIYADATIRNQTNGEDEFVQWKYLNARPQSNLTITQNATEPTALSVVFDLLAGEGNNLAEMKVVD